MGWNICNQDPKLILLPRYKRNVLSYCVVHLFPLLISSFSFLIF